MQPVFIVAQYKCGTSWLLSALSAHPAVVGLREIDIVRAVYDGGEAAGREHRLQHFFGKSAWCRDDVLDGLAAGEHDEPEQRNLNRPQGFADLSQEAAVGLYRTIRDAAAPEQALDAFLEANWSNAPDGATHLVLKAADQVAVFDLLQAWQPDAPKVAITRDGRDAAISAREYKKLMRAEDAPWYSGDADYWQLLGNWASRARMLADRSAAGDLYLIRYEDLSADFAGVFGKLLTHLGLDASPDLVDTINERTSFEARTGRKRGTSGKGIIRKGQVGEWRGELDDAEKAKAWDIAGGELEALGYSRS